METVKSLNQVIEKEYSVYHGDSCELIKGIPNNSIHYTISSIPFRSMYCYSATPRDLGNSKSPEEFDAHFQFLIDGLFRVTKVGRLVSIHLMQIPTTIQHHGFVGLIDFRGEVVRMFQRSGFIFHSEVCIWKDPVVAMQRTKAIGLLHKQLAKDSSISRQGIPDYVVTFRKPGKNEEPIVGKLEYFVGEDPPSLNGNDRDSINIWQRYASPVWDDINPSNTLQYQSARDNGDERHICPLQIQVIERCLQLWTNPGDVVLEPFMGIGSVPYVALKMGRKGIGFELKESYYKCAVNNLANLTSADQLKLF